MSKPVATGILKPAAGGLQRTFVVCEDGSVWVWDDPTSSWKAGRAIPGTQSDQDTKKQIKSGDA